jgi:hypothetical protein
MNKVHCTLLVFFGLASSVVQAQAPGRGNIPPAIPGPQPVVPVIPRQEERRDDHNAWQGLHHIGHAIPHGLGSHNGPATDHGPDLHTPGVVPPEVTVPPSQFRVNPASDFHFTPASEVHVPPVRFSSAVGEGGSAVAHGLAGAKGGGILAGIGGGIAGIFGSIFGRKKKS